MKGAVVHLRASAVPDAAAPFRRGLRLVSSLLLLLLPLLLALPFPTHAADDDDGALLALLKEERNERRLRMTRLMERAARGREPTTDEGRRALALHKRMATEPGAVDLAELHRLLKRAVERGDSEAMVLLGQLYQLGQGVSLDTTRARELFERAHAQGNPAGTYQLAQLYHDGGPGVERDAKKARALLEEAKAAGFDLAGIGLGQLDYREGRFVTAQLAFRHYAAQGYPQPYIFLAEMYTLGKGVKRDRARAIRLLQAAWYMGWPGAASQLYFAYEAGDGVPQDLGKAIEYLQQAVELGHVDSMADLCLFHIEGRYGLEKDLQKAFELCKASAEGGSALGAGNLAGMYQSTDIPQRSMEKYRYWTEVAAGRGHAFMMGMLAANYGQGMRGYPQDLQKAFEWARRSAEAGWPEGMFLYASLLGDDIEYDIPSLDGPDWGGCWYWMSIKHALIPGKQSEGIKGLCERKSSAEFRASKQEEIQRRIEEYRNNFWVVMYRRDVERGIRNRY